MALCQFKRPTGVSSSGSCPDPDTPHGLSGAILLDRRPMSSLIPNTDGDDISALPDSPLGPLSDSPSAPLAPSSVVDSTRNRFSLSLLSRRILCIMEVNRTERLGHSQAVCHLAIFCGVLLLLSSAYTQHMQSYCPTCVNKWFVVVPCHTGYNSRKFPITHWCHAIRCPGLFPPMVTCKLGSKIYTRSLMTLFFLSLLFLCAGAAFRTSFVLPSRYSVCCVCR
jgi:hypothetical protein